MSEGKEKGREIIRKAPKATAERYKTWEDLNELLESSFHNQPHRHNQRIAINLHEYKIDKNEIIEVLEEKNYKTKLGELQSGDEALTIFLKE